MSTAILLAQQALSVRADRLPQDVLSKARQLLLDQLGCMIAGGMTPQAQRLSGHLVQVERKGLATVFGRSERLMPFAAAHANAHSASILSLDDSVIRFGHPGASIIPAALAEAEARGATLTNLLQAIVAGYEVSLRIGHTLIGTAEREAVVKGNATWQIFGSVAAMANLRGMAVETAAHAFGIAAIHAPVPFIRKFHSRPMNWLKNNYGWACRGGITACNLAEAGFHGNLEIFDGEKGFWAMAGSDRSNPAAFSAGFGKDFLTLEVGFKPYGVCRWIHTTIDCIRELIAKHKLTPESVATIHVETVSEFVRDFNGPWPRDTLEAVFHIPYAVALELYGRSSEAGLDPTHLADPAMAAFGARISVDQLLGADTRFYEHGLLPSRVTVTINDGRTFQAETELPRGHPQGPHYGMTDTRAKFAGLVSPALGDAQASRLITAVETADDTTVSALMAGTAEATQ